MAVTVSMLVLIVEVWLCNSFKIGLDYGTVKMRCGCTCFKDVDCAF